MPYLTMGEVAKKTGLRPSAIRYYESMGILPEPMRVNGQRRYPQRVLLVLKAVMLARKVGFSMGEVQTLMSDHGGADSPAARWKTLAERKIAPSSSRRRANSRLLPTDGQSKNLPTPPHV